MMNDHGVYAAEIALNRGIMSVEDCCADLGKHMGSGGANSGAPRLYGRASTSKQRKPPCAHPREAGVIVPRPSLPRMGSPEAAIDRRGAKTAANLAPASRNHRRFTNHVVHPNFLLPQSCDGRS